MKPVVLIAAGLDPCGGAGLIADVVTARLRGLRPAGVVTALTLQSSAGCAGFESVHGGLLAGQLTALFEDLPIAAVKIGMVGSAEAARAIARVLAAPARSGLPIVFDPVLQASAGADLFAGDPVRDLAPILSLATLVTPNRDEAARLAGVVVDDADGQVEAARQLRRRGARAVLVKGGHIAGERVADLLDDGDPLCWFDGGRLPGPVPHGTGCALSMEIACLLALGTPLRQAVAAGRARLIARLAAPVQFGRGRPFLGAGGDDVLPSPPA